MEELVQLTGVTKKYGSQAALDSVTLRIPRGQVTAIMGPSGSGKSTLLNLVAGLDRTTEGSITVDGQEITDFGEGRLARFRRDKIGLIFQFFNLLNNLTALDNVVISAELAGMSRKAAIRRSRGLLDQLEIGEYEKSFPSRLSGGQRQRVAIARAIVNEPVLLLADEPTGALDTHSGEQVLDLFRDLNRTGQTIVLVTHDRRLAEAYADRIISLVDGRVEEDRPLLLEAVR